VHDAYLFVLQIHTSSFGAALWGGMVPLFFSVAQDREVFHGLSVQGVAEFDSD
jgi:hypothetical protein